jgi:hypothetical protein
MSPMEILLGEEEQDHPELLELQVLLVQVFL